MEDGNLQSATPTALVTARLRQISGFGAERVAIPRGPDAHPLVIARFAPTIHHLPRDIESSEPQGNSAAADPRADWNVCEKLDDLRLGKIRAEVLQQWEGVVASDAAHGDQFRAVIRDLTCPANPEEEVELSVDEVSPSDRPLMVKGAVFYWTIAYETTAEGQLKRVSLLRFRRLPVWTRGQIDRARLRAHRWVRAFGVKAAGEEAAAG